MADLRVTLCGVPMQSPVIAASGTFGFGREYGQFYDLGELGGICAKGLTLHRREGNPGPRIAETPMGILNSVGLQNPGVDAFVETELPFLRQYDVKVIANISGNTPEEYGIMCEKLAQAGVDLIEVNISCPNVKAGGLAYGTRPELAAEVTQVAKAHAGSVPVMVKLSPNVTDITEIARAVAGAVFLARQHKTKEQIRTYLRQYYPLDFRLEDIRDSYQGDATCEGSVPQALEAFLEAENFEDALRNAVSLGGDTDTLAAMAGSIAEPFFGIPEKILEEGRKYYLPEMGEEVK